MESFWLFYNDFYCSCVGRLWLSMVSRIRLPHYCRYCSVWIDMCGFLCIASQTQPNQTMLWSLRWPDTPRQSPPSSSAQMESGLPAPVSPPTSHDCSITTPHHMSELHDNPHRMSSPWQPCITFIFMTTLHHMSAPWQPCITWISLTTLHHMSSPLQPCITCHLLYNPA